MLKNRTMQSNISRYPKRRDRIINANNKCHWNFYPNKKNETQSQLSLNPPVGRGSIMLLSMA